MQAVQLSQVNLVGSANVPVGVSIFCRVEEPIHSGLMIPGNEPSTGHPPTKALQWGQKVSSGTEEMVTLTKSQLQKLLRALGTNGKCTSSWAQCGKNWLRLEGRIRILPYLVTHCWSLYLLLGSFLVSRRAQTTRQPHRCFVL